MGMRRSTRLARELADDRSARLGECHLSRHVLRKLCREADNKTNGGDRDGLRVARLAVRLARRLLDLERWEDRPDRSWELASSFSRLSAALRLANRLDHADLALEIAFEVGTPDLAGDLHRRRAWLRMYQLRLSDALEDARSAKELTENAEEHALALGVLGGALYYTGQYAAAIRRFKAALVKMNPEDGHRYSGMLVSYIAALGKGTDDDAHAALELCPMLRSRLKPRHKMQRAKLWWSEGLLRHRVGDPEGAWRALDVARRSLMAMKAAPEVAAIVSDMARISPQPMAVRHICTEAGSVIKSPHPLTEPLHALTRAAENLIPEAAAGLRQAAGALALCPSL